MKNVSKIFMFCSLIFVTLLSCSKEPIEPPIDTTPSGTHPINPVELNRSEIIFKRISESSNPELTHSKDFSVLGRGQYTHDSVLYDCVMELDFSKLYDAAKGEMILSPATGSNQPIIYSLHKIKPMYQSNLFEPGGNIFEFAGRLQQNENTGSIEYDNISLYISHAGKFLDPFAGYFEAQIKVRFF